MRKKIIILLSVILISCSFNSNNDNERKQLVQENKSNHVDMQENNSNHVDVQEEKHNHAEKQDNKSKDIDIQKNKKYQSQKIENFKMFLQKFINDSTFRYTRIQFPINGYNSDAEINKKNYKWNKKEWDFYSEEDFQYKKNENITMEIMDNDTTKIWCLYKKQSGYDIRYYFKPIDSKWNLVYYSYSNY